MHEVSRSWRSLESDERWNRFVTDEAQLRPGPAAVLAPFIGTPYFPVSHTRSEPYAALIRSAQHVLDNLNVAEVPVRDKLEAMITLCAFAHDDTEKVTSILTPVSSFMRGDVGVGALIGIDARSFVDPEVIRGWQDGRAKHPDFSTSGQYVKGLFTNSIAVAHNVALPDRNDRLLRAFVGRTERCRSFLGPRYQGSSHVAAEGI